MEWRSYGSAFEVVLGRGDARKIRGETPVPCDAGAWKGIRVRDGLMALAPGPSGCTVDVEMRVLRLCAGGARAVLDSIDAGEMAVVCTAFTEQMRTVSGDHDRCFSTLVLEGFVWWSLSSSRV